MNALRDAALQSKAWPFEEARRLLKRYPDGKPDGSPMLFETGYGPSGLPHIGTFQEVQRTTWVKQAYETMTGGAPTRLIAFSDDMDGFRKVPGNVPEQEMLTENLHKPLTQVPDPYGKYESFAHHNNAMLREFLDRFGFDYEFMSSTEQYTSGAFDKTLKLVLARYDQIMDIMLPTLGEERRATYSPVLPISPKSGHVLQVPVEVVDAEAGTVRFEDDGDVVEHNILSGGAKLQWKADWALRWVALGVDYEMYGKDLTESGVQSGRIAKVLGGRKPEGLIYELFLDENGEKISKSKGNGLTIEEWLTYGSEKSLSFYIFPNPKSAKQLHLGVVPRAVDDCEQFRKNWHGQELEKQLGNPVHHIYNGDVPVSGPPITFGLLLNLASVLGPVATKDDLWNYLGIYVGKDVNSPTWIEQGDDFGEELDEWIEAALAYNRDFVASTLERRKPEGVEVAALERLDTELAALPADTAAEDIQTIIYTIGKEGGFENLRDWFKALYETLLGASQGPRMGSFTALYGIDNVRKLIAEALESA